MAYCIALNFHRSLISQILPIIRHSQKYLNKIDTRHTFHCRTIDGQHCEAKLPNLQGMAFKVVYTFKVGIALLTAASLSSDTVMVC